MMISARANRMKVPRLLLALVLNLVAVDLHAQVVEQSSLHDALGQLVKTTDSTGVVVEYVYDMTGNLIEIKRSITDGLSIAYFTPGEGLVGSVVTIQGQRFSAIPGANDVRFNGTAATVLSASPLLLTVTVPPGATSGPITVTVGGETATSAQPFAVVATPVITGVAPQYLVSFGSPYGNDGGGTQLTKSDSQIQITGTNLTGSTFTFLPEIVPAPLTVNSTTIDPSGNSATLGVTIASRASGSFTVVATNGSGSSSAFSSSANTITVLEGALDPDGDGLTNAQEVAAGTDPFRADTDGDEFPDGYEVAAGSNPLNPQSTPVSLAYAVVSVLNRTDPGTGAGVVTSGPLSVLNRTDPAAAQGAFFGLTISVFNQTDPSASNGVLIAPPVSVFNITAPQGYAIGSGVSVNNVPP